MLYCWMKSFYLLFFTRERVLSHQIISILLKDYFFRKKYFWKCPFNLHLSFPFLPHIISSVFVFSYLFSRLLFSIARRKWAGMLHQVGKGVALSVCRDRTILYRTVSVVGTSQSPVKWGALHKRNENFGEAASGKLRFGGLMTARVTQQWWSDAA